MYPQLNSSHATLSTLHPLTSIATLSKLPPPRPPGFVPIVIHHSKFLWATLFLIVRRDLPIPMNSFVARRLYIFRLRIILVDFAVVHHLAATKKHLLVSAADFKGFSWLRLTPMLDIARDGVVVVGVELLVAVNTVPDIQLRLDRSSSSRLDTRQQKQPPPPQFTTTA